MLILAGKDKKRSADDFFNDIMKVTGTVILWPSRLKIGAKSKKGERGERERERGRERGGREKEEIQVLQRFDTVISLKIRHSNFENK